MPIRSGVSSLPATPPGPTRFRSEAPIPLIVNGRFLSRRVTGVERVARGIVGALESRMDGDGLVRFGETVFRPRIAAPAGPLLAPPKRMPVLRSARLQGNAWEQCALPWAARDGLLLNLCNTAPLCAGPQVTYVHDAGVYAITDAYGWRFRHWYRALHRAYRLRGDALLTNSVFSARELQRFAGFPRDRLHVAAPGCDHIHEVALAPLPMQVDLLARTRGYFLIVASRAPHKNVDTALAAHAAFLRRHPDGPALVLVGGRHGGVFEDASPPDRDNDHVLRLGYVADPTMVAMLRRARGLIFPSRYEGFGLPLAEAMSAGCPVIASDLPTTREIGIDACWSFPPGDVDALTAALVAVASRSREVHAKVVIGRHRAAQLTWDRCTDTVLATLRDACTALREMPA
jgi:glycosyltransferase involved in cell wall biosynthesis